MLRPALALCVLFAVLGCEDDPEDLDHLRDAGTDAAAEESSEPEPEPGPEPGPEPDADAG